MDLSNPVIQLIILGTQAEYSKNPQEACNLYQQAWQICSDSYEFCMAAHYIARCQPTPEEKCEWNRIALKYAQEIVQDPRITPFLPSLYLSLGSAYEELGNFDQSAHFFQLAADLGVIHQKN
ncbi:MAG: hypothetical protein ACYDH1_02965 [Anaerolineaceae bacterium]